MYKVIPFLLNKHNSYVTVQTTKSIVIIENDNLIDLFTFLDNNKSNELNDSILIHFFDKSNFDSVYSFLKENNLIYSSEKPILNFSRVLLISNNSIFSKNFDSFFKDFNIHIEIADFSNFKNKFENNKFDLCYIFSTPFNLNEYESINNEVIKFNTTIKNIFFYNNSLYLSNYYNKKWLNPCPKCFFSNLEEQLRNNIGNDEVGFQTIIDLIYKKNPKFEVNCNLQSIDILPILFLLALELKNSKFDYIIDEVNEISLNSYKTTKDYAIHWELCDCYE